jgi:hypothetical protein
MERAPTVVWKWRCGVFKVEFFAAEGDFLFLDGGVAFADGGVFAFMDEGPNAFEFGKVVGIGVAIVGGGEVEGLLFEEFEGVGGEAGVASDCVFAEFGGSFPGGVEVVGEFRNDAAPRVALDGGKRDFVLKFAAAKGDDFAVGHAGVEPVVDVLELALAEAGEAGEAAGGTNGIFLRPEFCVLRW